MAAGVEALPAALTGLADLVTVRFPWGSLLRGVLGLDSGVAASIARLVAPGGHLEITLSLVARDHHDTAGDAFGAADIERMTASFAMLGLIRPTRAGYRPPKSRRSRRPGRAGCVPTTSARGGPSGT